MNTKTAIAATLLALGSSVAMAQEATPWPELRTYQSVASREAVHDETTRAIAYGFPIIGGEATRFRHIPYHAQMDRADVRMQANEAPAPNTPGFGFSIMYIN